MLMNTGSRISLHNVGNYVGQVKMFAILFHFVAVVLICRFRIFCHFIFVFVLDYYELWLFLILQLQSWCCRRFMIMWLLSISLVWCNCYITLWFLNYDDCDDRDNCDDSIIVISPQGGEPSSHPWLQKQRGEKFLNLVKIKVREGPFWNVLFPYGHWEGL